MMQPLDTKDFDYYGSAADTFSYNTWTNPRDFWLHALMNHL